MAESFHARIPKLPDAALRDYVTRPRAYQRAAVELAVAELARRGQALAPTDLRRLREALAQREADQRGQAGGWGRWLGTAPARRTARVRLVTALILVAGLGSAAVIRWTAPPRAPNPLGYEPEDTKKYLRDLELYGGKANVLATEFRRGWESLWQGQRLGTTVATLTVLAAAGFWIAAHRPPVDPDRPPGDRLPL